MKSLVVYVTHKGNTRQVAQAIGDALRSHGEAVVLPVEDAPSTIDPSVDLLLVGGPTEAHGVTPDAVRYLERLDGPSLRGRPVAAFDTRVNWPRILSGSAADGIAKRLTAIGARVIAPQGSFIVDTEPTLMPGELDRARDWAEIIARSAVPTPA